MKYCISFMLFFLLTSQLLSQQGSVSGVITDEIQGSELAYANISVDDSDLIVESDSTGRFDLKLKAGFHKIEISYLGYQAVIFHQVKADPIKPNFLIVKLTPAPEEIDNISITANSRPRTAETPLSVQNIGINEITRLPGATIDVSKVIKNLPGVLPKVSFGYNIIVRGGASHENKFFIDGIEIPSINHFSVQGISGGPNGLVNVDLLKRAKLITGAFPANRSNALSSVLNLETRSGRNDRLGGKFTLGATDVGITVEGPVSKNSNFILSGRKSFSEYYLKAFKLPILPAYSDYNFKFESKWNRSELKVIAIGAIDKSRLNLDDASDPDASSALLYNTGYIPEGDQQVHTLGMNYKQNNQSGFTRVIASTSFFRNKAIKYFNNSYQTEDLWFDYNAARLDTRFRVEQNQYYGKNQLKFGFSGEQTNYNLSNYSIEVGSGLQPIVLDFKSQMSIFQYGFFASYGSRILNDKLQIFGGIRTDASTYGSLTRNILSHISPRLSLSYDLTKKSKISATAGSYYQLPPAVILAYSEDSQLSNRDRIDFIRSDQLALGYTYQISEDKSFSIETFYKKYSDYPFLLRDSISFANANADYVAVGNQPASSISEGRAYGLEVFVQKRFRDKSLWSAVYNYSKSEFSDKNGDFISSSWDTRHFMTLVYARTFGKDWQWGAKFTYASSSPYTPFDIERSSQVDFWTLNRRGVFDFDRLNTSSLNPFHQLDFRIDKNIYRKKYTANFYLDIQNIYSSAIQFVPYLVPIRGEDGNFLLDENDPSRYQTELISSDSGRVLPTIGVIIEL